MTATRLVVIWAPLGLIALLGGPYLPAKTQVWLSITLAIFAALICLVCLVRQ